MHVAVRGGQVESRAKAGGGYVSVAGVDVTRADLGTVTVRLSRPLVLLSDLTSTRCR
jgi:hydrogenase maturation factor HypE